MSGFLLETGNLFPNYWIYAGGSADNPPNTLYAGAGDYSSLINGGFRNITVQQQPNNSFIIEEFSLGTANADLNNYQNGIGYAPVSTFFSTIGLSSGPQSALIAANYRGLGLPYYLWYSVINMLVQGGITDMTCVENEISGCSLPEPCDFYNIWHGSVFKIKFVGVNNYNFMPLSALSYTSESKCYLDINYLTGDAASMQNQVIFGATFMQQFTNYWEYNLTANTTTANMQLSTYFTNYNVYIGSASFSTHSSPFTLLKG